MKATLSGSQISRTVLKALRILETLCSDQPDWGIRQLGRELNIDPATVYRLINTLNATGFVEQNSANKRYLLGPKVMKLSSAYNHHNPLPTIAMKVFGAYSEKFAYNFYLGALSNFYVFYLAVLDGRGPIQLIIDPGATLDLHCTALGKALLAFQDEEYIQEYLDTHELHKYTPRTITEAEHLIEHLSTIREHGYAINEGEYFDNIGAVAVPVHDNTDKLTMGVCLGYPIPLMDKERLRVNEMILLAKEISDEITLRLVGTPGGKTASTNYSHKK